MLDSCGGHGELRNPTLKPLPTEDSPHPMMATPVYAGGLWWPEPQNSETENRDACTPCEHFSARHLTHDSHNSPARFSDYGKPFVSQNLFMILSTNFPVSASQKLCKPPRKMKPSYDPKTQFSFSNYGDHSGNIALPLHTQMYKSNSVFQNKHLPGVREKGNTGNDFTGSF